MDSILIHIETSKSDYICGEQIVIKNTVENSSSEPATFYDIGKGQIFEYELIRTGDNFRTVLSYNIARKVKSPENRQTLLPPLRELKSGEILHSEEKLGTYAIKGIVSGTYKLVASIIYKSQKYLSNTVALTISAADPVTETSICDPRNGNRSSVMVHKNGTQEMFYQAFSNQVLPNMDSYYQFYTRKELQHPVSISLPIILFQGKPFFWISWVDGQNVNVTYVAANGYVKKEEPYSFKTDLLNARIVSTEAHISEEQAFFFVYGELLEKHLVYTYEINCKSGLIKKVSEFSLPSFDQNVLYVTYGQAQNTARFVWFKNNSNSADIYTVSMDLKTLKSTDPVSFQLKNTILDLGVGLVSTDSDNQLANVLAGNSSSRELTVYTLTENGNISQCAQFEKPQGPVKSWKIGAGTAYSIPIVAISDTYLLWTETRQCKAWKTLAHASNSLSYLTIHTIPDGLAYRRYLEGKFWAEYFDGEKFSTVPIPGILRE